MFEGIGGCGKGTQLEMLREELTGRGKKVFCSREHSRDTSIGRLIEATIKKESEPIESSALQLVFVADRINHSERVLRPELTRVDFVLEDRYEASTISYAPEEQKRYFLELHHHNPKILKPDLTIILDLEPREAARRVGKRGDADIFDTAEKMKVCREGYLWYKENSGHSCTVVEAGGSRDEVFKRIMGKIEKAKLLG